jgi:hypothetical protein
MPDSTEVGPHQIVVTRFGDARHILHFAHAPATSYFQSLRYGGICLSVFVKPGDISPPVGMSNLSPALCTWVLGAFGS